MLWFQSDGPRVGGHEVSPKVDAAGVDALVELVGDDSEVSVLHDDVSWDGGQDLLAVFIPAGGDKPPWSSHDHMDPLPDEGRSLLT